MLRDFQASFSDSPDKQFQTVSIVGGIAAPYIPTVYVAPNSIDLAPYGSLMTQLSAADTFLIERYPELVSRDIGNNISMVIQWTEYVVASDPSVMVRMQLVSADDLQQSGSRNPTDTTIPVLMDFGALPAAQYFRGFRQIWRLPSSNSYRRWLTARAIVTGPPAGALITAGAFASWLALDVDSPTTGYAEGFEIK